MRLTKKNITHYLLDKGFLASKDFLMGDYILTQTQSRNSIFKVAQEEGGLFIKQLVTMDPQNVYLMQKDATSHYLIHNTKAYQKTASYIPEYHGYDPNHHILVTEYFNGVNNLHETIFENKEFVLSHATDMASILASYHFDVSKEVENNPSLQFYTKIIPWIFQVTESGNATLGNEVNNIVIQAVKSFPELLNQLASLKKEWKATSLIHGDIKWVNFVLKKNDKGEDELKLVDWEIADIGDPLWDVAGVIQSYLTSWVFTFDNNSFEHKQVPGFEFISLETIQPMVKAFWERYAKDAKIAKKDQSKALERTIGYTASRMLQTVFEGNMAYQHLLPNSARVIQFCSNMLTDPKLMAKELFGIN